MAFKQGDESAARRIFDRYKRRVLNFALRMLGNRAQAEDAASEVFVAVFSKKYEARGGVEFSTWIFTVTRNRCLSEIRRRGRVSGVSMHGEDAQRYDVADERATPAQQSQETEAAQLVRRAIAGLSDDQREVIILREYEHLSYEDISRITGHSLSNVKVLIFRAREMLKARLSCFFNEEEARS